jgi:hypothetical protein
VSRDRRLEIEALPGETRAFLWTEDLLIGLAVQRAGEGLRAGDRAVGRVRALDRRLNAAFIALPSGADGLLPFNAASGLGAGDAVAVRVKRAAAEDKGPLLAPDRALPAAALLQGPVPRLIERGPGPLQPLLQGDPIFCDDRALADDLRAAGEEVTFLPRGFDAERTALQDAAVEACLSPAVAVRRGSLLIEPGRTLTAIDVNLGADEGVAFYYQAACEIALQVQRRALAGRFVVDFPDEARDLAFEAIRGAFQAFFADDPARTKLIGWSRGGLYEFTRRRLGPSLYETLMEPAPYGGWQKQPLTLALEAARAYDRSRRAAPARRRRLLLRPDLLALWPTLPVARWLAERAGGTPWLDLGAARPWELEEGA